MFIVPLSLSSQGQSLHICQLDFTPAPFLQHKQRVRLTAMEGTSVECANELHCMKLIERVTSGVVHTTMSGEFVCLVCCLADPAVLAHRRMDGEAGTEGATLMRGN